PRPSRFFPYTLSQRGVRVIPELACGILGNEYDESCLVCIVPLKVAPCDDSVPHGMNKPRRDRLHSMNGWNFSFTVCSVFGIQDIDSNVGGHRSCAGESLRKYAVNIRDLFDDLVLHL